MGETALTVGNLLHSLKNAANGYKDIRKGNNLQYKVVDAVMGATSCFFMQEPSFLSYQNTLKTMAGDDNARTLFEVVNIPSDNQIRNILDVLPLNLFDLVFRYCVKELCVLGVLDSFRISGWLTIAIDATGYFSSTKLHCENCTVKVRDKGTDKEKMYYEHSVITPVIVSPNTTDVIPLEPEYITPQDGNVKQDCENKAAKRWLSAYGEYYSQYEITFVGDDLYSHQPLCLDILGKRCHFILVCKPDSHQYLYQWVKDLKEGKDKVTIIKRIWDEKLHTHTVTTYQYANHVPIRDSADALFVNFVEVTIIDEKNKEQLYHNAFITDHKISEENVGDIVVSGRARWNIENGNNNILKTKGYHFEHNYGHGKKNLSMIITTLIMIVFLFHTILHLVSKPYQYLREKLPREKFFHHLSALTSYLIYDDWDHLFAFMINGLTQKIKAASLTFGARAPNVGLSIVFE